MSENVIIPVLDAETGEIVELEIDQDCLDEMDRRQSEIDQRNIERRKREHEEIRYDRD